MMEKSDRNNNLNSDAIVQDSWLLAIQNLLKQSKVSFLASSGEFGPESTMAPYAVYHGKVLLHLSKLAKHTGNIERVPNIGLMICTPEMSGESPLALARLSLQGQVSKVADEQLIAAKEVYLKSIPDAEALFSFTDFQLFQFTPESVHWVGGFGKARKVSLQKWQTITQ